MAQARAITVMARGDSSRPTRLRAAYTNAGALTMRVSVPVSGPAAPPLPVRSPAPAPAPVPVPTPKESVAAKPAPAAKAPAPASSGTAKGPYLINVGLFANADNARKAHAKLVDAGLPAQMQELPTAKGPRTRVRVGPFKIRTEADAAAQKIRALRLDAAVVGG